MTTTEWREAERVRFEAWVKREWPEFDRFDQHVSGHYADKSLGKMFVGWLAAKRDVVMTPERILAAQKAVRHGNVCGAMVGDRGVFCDDPRLPDEIRQLDCDCKATGLAALTAALQPGEG